MSDELVVVAQRRNAFYPSFHSRNKSMGSPKNEGVEVFGGGAVGVACGGGGGGKKTVSPPSRVSEKGQGGQFDLLKMLLPKKAPIKKSSKKVTYVPKRRKE